MRTIDVIILKGGCSAMEINPLGDKPKLPVGRRASKDEKARVKRDTKEWKEAEKARRTFPIDFSHLMKLFQALEKAVGAKIQHAQMGFDEGAHHKAEILHTGRIKIIR